ncbi:MAG: GAF domain-containing sensor histidine kinase [Anaerolineae bacterium]|nr:GAF domain-containing sensor histidine kinase [Anaerolineae bacterium]
MAEQLLRANASTSPESIQTYMDDFFDLAAAGNLDTMLRKALGMVVRLLGAEAGSILFQAQTEQHFRSGPFRPEALARIKRWEEVISQRLANSAWNIAGGAAVPISTSRLAENQLVLVNIPLVRHTTVVGSLSLVLPPGSEVTEERRDLLVRIAKGMGRMASLIIELELAQQRLNQMEIFYQVGQALMTTFDVNKLLSDTMQLAVNVIDAGAASIMLVDEKREELVFEVSHGSRAKMLRQQRIPIDEGIAGWVAQHGQPVIANDARTDPRFSHRVDVRTGFLTQSIAAVPMKIKGRVIGVLEVLNKYSEDGFSKEDVRLMSSIAAQSAIAIENARLYQQVRQERDHIIKAQENVRRELARNLHDGPVQLLSAISMSLDHLERLNRVKPEAVHNEIIALRNLVHQATRDARTLLFEMRPVVLETQGLTAAFEHYVNQLRDSEDFVIRFKTTGQVDYDIQVAGTIFSIAQEAINNIKRHARARNILLSLGVEDNRFMVIIQDDGCGFEVNKMMGESMRTGHFGLLNMRERAELIEAELSIESRTEAPNRGTIIRLVLPLPADMSLKQPALKQP